MSTFLSARSKHNISGVVDGMVFTMEQPYNSLQKSALYYNQKIAGYGVLALFWVLLCGMMIARTPLVAGKCSESS